ncbi:retrovirus-related pol polyprotein from transposon TNT 1-94 [Tanacetum coccineum]|uniref:Retrovirus-related pol polyprotein from transposon TNT 1-94 n=1 Tax=Tanacetum coccineum TaxID=301880 RepID=A0ABQ5IKH5_9ASTR
MVLDSRFGQQAMTTPALPKTRSMSVNGMASRLLYLKRYGGTMPDYYSNGVRYVVSWRDVKKVYFPVNEPKKQWCIAELQISTRVVTFYDSLGCKAISVETFQITYMFPKVVEQAYLYGDCGVWAKKESSNEECSTSRSEDEEYAMVVRDFKKFFKRNSIFVRQPQNDKKMFQRSRDDKMNQRAFVGGSWIDSGEKDDEKVNNETCLVARASSEVCSESSYFSDENSSIDELVLDNEYDKLCKISLKIITKNKRLKATRNNLEKELSVLKEKVSTLEKNKGVDLECVKCYMLKIENEKLKEEVTRLNKFEKSTQCLNEMLSNQKPSSEKLGLGFNSFEASSSGTKEIKFVKAQKKASSDRGPINMGGPQSVKAAPKTIMGPLPVGTHGSEKNVSFQKSILGPRPKHILVNNVRVPVASDNEICLGVDLEPDEWIKDSGCSKHMTGNRKLFSSYKAYNGGNVIFGSNLRGNIIGKGQICDNKCRVTFSEHDSEITKDGKVIVSKELARNLPKLKFDQHLCDACKIGKQTHASDKAKNIVSMTRCLELLHMDLFGPSAVRKPKNMNEALGDESWMVAMQEELNQFIANDVWELVPQPRNMTIIGTNWVFRNKLDENDFKLFQMDVKSAFLNGFINEEKQTALAISTTEAEYVSAGKACQQALWMKQALIDYDVRLDDVPIMCDNKGAIDLSKNPVQHSRTKHIEIRHHFLRDNVQKGHISIEKVPSVDNIADILTKPLKRESFNYLRLGLGMMEHIP